MLLLKEGLFIFTALNVFYAQPAVEEEKNTKLVTSTDLSSTHKTKWILSNCQMNTCPFNCYRPVGYEHPKICIKSDEDHLDQLCACKSSKHMTITPQSALSTTLEFTLPTPLFVSQISDARKSTLMHTVQKSEDKCEMSQPTTTTNWMFSFTTFLIGYFLGILCSVAWCLVISKQTTMPKRRRNSHQRPINAWESERPIILKAATKTDDYLRKSYSLDHKILSSHEIGSYVVKEKKNAKVVAPITIETIV